MIDWFGHEYPYSNLHELNLDWLIDKMKELEGEMDGLEEKILQTVKDWVEPYVDEQLNVIREEMDSFRVEMNEMREYFNTTIATLNEQYADFVADVDGRISALESRIDGFTEYVDRKIDECNRETESKIAQSNARTDEEIAEAMAVLREEIAQGVAGVKVVNYFTGQLVSIQEMTNFLASLHTENAITYTELAGANITYTQYEALHMTYTELALKGKSFIIP